MHKKKCLKYRTGTYAIDELIIIIIFGLDPEPNSMSEFESGSETYYRLDPVPDLKLTVSDPQPWFFFLSKSLVDS